MTFKRTIVAALALPLLLALAACQKQDAAEGKGPAERVGAQVDQAASRAAEALNKAGEKAGEALQKGGEKLEGAAKEAQRKE